MFSINIISVDFLNTFFAYYLNACLIAAPEKFQNFEKWFGLSPPKLCGNIILGILSTLSAVKRAQMP